MKIKRLGEKQPELRKQRIASNIFICSVDINKQQKTSEINTF